MAEANKFINRKSLIYKTNVEYGDHTINHIQGCAHGCKYPCYAFLMAKRFGKIKTYEEWIEPAIVENTMELLDREIPKFKDKITSLHLCFTTDPFMYGYEDIAELSIQVLNKLNSNGIKCTALTKGVLPLELTSLSKENEYGITLISLNEKFRQKIEPGSAPYAERIESLKKLHDAGCKTWVSIEPYPTPNIIDQDINEILTSIGFVDKIIFGRLNYNPAVSAYRNHRSFFNNLAQIVIDFCQNRKIQYHIKKGTLTEENYCEKQRLSV